MILELTAPQMAFVKLALGYCAGKQEFNLPPGVAKDMARTLEAVKLAERQRDAARTPKTPTTFAPPPPPPGTMDVQCTEGGS